jgi:hypothetical protein
MLYTKKYNLHGVPILYIADYSGINTIYMIENVDTGVTVYLYIADYSGINTIYMEFLFSGTDSAGS